MLIAIDKLFPDCFVNFGLYISIEVLGIDDNIHPYVLTLFVCLTMIMELPGFG